MPFDITLRYSKQVRDQLIWLKRRTGLPHFHTLCRWGFCISMADTTPARAIQAGGDAEERQGEQQQSANGQFELPWHRFGQADADVLAALLTERVIQEGNEPTDEILQQTAQAHIQRGISRMMVGKKIRSIADLVEMASSNGINDSK